MNPSDDLNFANYGCDRAQLSDNDLYQAAFMLSATNAAPTMAYDTTNMATDTPQGQDLMFTNPSLNTASYDGHAQMAGNCGNTASWDMGMGNDAANYQPLNQFVQQEESFEVDPNLNFEDLFPPCGSAFNASGMFDAPSYDNPSTSDASNALIPPRNLLQTLRTPTQKREHGYANVDFGNVYNPMASSSTSDSASRIANSTQENPNWDFVGQQPDFGNHRNNTYYDNYPSGSMNQFPEQPYGPSTTYVGGQMMSNTMTWPPSEGQYMTQPGLSENYDLPRAPTSVPSYEPEYNDNNSHGREAQAQPVASTSGPRYEPGYDYGSSHGQIIVFPVASISNAASKPKPARKRASRKGKQNAVQPVASGSGLQSHDCELSIIEEFEVPFPPVDRLNLILKNMLHLTEKYYGVTLASGVCQKHPRWKRLLH